MEARPPDSEHIMPRCTFRSRAYQLAHDPESLVTIAFDGTRGDNSHTVRCGLTPVCAGSCARFSSMVHQSAVHPSIFLRHARSGLASSNGRSARKVSVLSPTRFASMG